MEKIFFADSNRLNELSIIESNYNKTFIWNYLAAITIFRDSP
jgi:hypothetical protein